MAKAVDFLDDDDIIDFFININPKFKLKDIPGFVRKASAETLQLKTETCWESSSDTILVDGLGTDCIQSSRVPIISISEVVIIRSNEVEVSLILSGENRHVVWDYETGIFSLLSNFNAGVEFGVVTTFENDGLGDTTPVWPCGLQNIRIKGVFGDDETPTSLLKLIQLLLIAKSMQMVSPSVYTFDVVREKIGRYEYRLMEGNANSNRRTMDDYIDYLCSLLPKIEFFGIEAIG